MTDYPSVTVESITAQLEEALKATPAEHWYIGSLAAQLRRLGRDYELPLRATVFERDNGTAMIDLELADGSEVGELYVQFTWNEYGIGAVEPCGDGWASDEARAEFERANGEDWFRGARMLEALEAAEIAIREDINAGEE